MLSTCFWLTTFTQSWSKEERYMAVQPELEFFRELRKCREMSRASAVADLQISTPRWCASHVECCNSLERALANQLAACKKMQKYAKIKRVKEDSSVLCTILLQGFLCSYHALPCSFVQFIFLKRVNFERLTQASFLLPGAWQDFRVSWPRQEWSGPWGFVQWQKWQLLR